MDIKVGSEGFAGCLSPEKLEYRKKKDEGSTGSSLGLRIIGMRVSDPHSDAFTFRNKSWGRSLTAENFSASLFLFFENSSREFSQVVINKYIRDLEDIRLWLKKQSYLKFYSSSILLVYDGADPNGKVNLKLIDFAHTKPIVDGDHDDSSLRAVENLLDVFKRFPQTTKFSRDRLG